jgi:hypothetical protein
MVETIKDATLRELVEAKSVRSATALARPGGFAISARYGITERALATSRGRLRLFTLDAASKFLSERGLPRFEARSAAMLLLAAIVLWISPLYAASVSVDYSREVPRIDQGGSNLCWLAAAAMMVSWKERGDIDMRGLANRLGPPFVDLFSNGSGANWHDVDLLARRLALRVSGLSSVPTSWWVARMKDGPIFVAGADGRLLAHARVLVQMNGDDASSARLKVTYIDSNGGRLKTSTLAEVIAFFERLPATGTAPSAQVLTFSN